MASNVFQYVLLLALALQCSCLQARSTPGDYEDQFSLPQEYQTGLEFSQTPSFFDTDQWNTPSDVPSFDQYYSASDGNDASGGDPVQEDALPFTFEGDQQYSMFASTDQSEPSEVDSASITSDEVSSDSTAGVELSGLGDVADEDIEVYFDTSDADTIYKAPDDDGLSLPASDFMSDPTTVDGMLASLAEDMGGCGTGNPIDDCWRCDPNWRSHRKALASCVTGFGRNTKGGKNGRIYTVTNSTDDAENPTPGTLRYGVTRTGPLWIIFEDDMTIALAGELWVNSYKTIDGRGAKVHLVGAQTTIQNASHVIVHGIHIHDMKVTGPTAVRVNETGVVIRVKSDGDGLHILNSKNVWVDHCYLARSPDGLLDVTRGSTGITVSNNLFEEQNKVMLFGSSPDWTADTGMRVTVAYNRFGEGLVQRMPRCRYGTFHVVNNHYSDGWGLYAIGGSENPMILSQGNVFSPSKKEEVTKHIDDDGPLFGGWKKWNWASKGDIFLGGSFFTGSGFDVLQVDKYAKAFSTSPRPAQLVPAITKAAGPLTSL